MSKSKENLMAAFAGESQANRKYLAFAKKAEKEGYAQVAKLFRASAEAETIHAHAHLAAADAIGSTVDNLKVAVEGETYEFKDMYPPMIETAKAEGDKKAERSFSWACEAEKNHAELYSNALEEMESLDAADYYVCKLCGHIHAGQPTENCPICMAKPNAYYKVV
jgi:rubrerythrin